MHRYILVETHNTTTALKLTFANETLDRDRGISSRNKLDLAETPIMATDKVVMESPQSNKQVARMWVLILLATIPILIAVVQNAIYLSNYTSTDQTILEIRESVERLRKLGRLVHRLTQEMSVSTLYVASGGNQNIYGLLLEPYRATAEALEAGPTGINWPGEYNNAAALHRALETHRLAVRTQLPIAYDEVKVYTNIIRTLIQWIGDIAAETEDSSGAWYDMVAFHMLAATVYETGAESAIGSVYFTKGKFKKCIRSLNAKFGH